MAASANPPAGNNSGQEGASNGNGATSNGLSVPENSVVGPTQAALRHNPGLSVDWTPDEQSLLEELLAKSERVTDSMPKSTHVATRTNGPPYAQSVMSMDSDDGISYKAIGGTTGQLLEQNAQALDQISANFAVFKIQENINLFTQARNNILTILNEYVLDYPFPFHCSLHTRFYLQ
ncbi:unnamed protein product [Withania somnifera]